MIFKNRPAGLLGLINTYTLGDDEVKLIEKTFTNVFGWPKITLSQGNEGQMVKNTIVLYLINQAFSHVRRAQGVSSLWLYRNLYYLRNNTSDTRICNLANILLQCLLYTNERDFIPIFANIKDTEFILRKLKTRTSWEFMDDTFCIHELIFYFHASVVESTKTDLEITLLGGIPNMSKGYDFETTCEHLKRNVKHTFMGIEEEREFYANEIYDYIDKQIKIDPHFGYE